VLFLFLIFGGASLLIGLGLGSMGGLKALGAGAIILLLASYAI